MTSQDLDDVGYARAVQVEIELEAAKRRRTSPELSRLEEDLKRSWSNVAPGAAGSGTAPIFERVEQLSAIEVEAPVGKHAGISQLKLLTKKMVRWYLRFVVDQLNTLHYFQSRLLRGIDKRLLKLESDSRYFGKVSELLDPIPQSDPMLEQLMVERLASVDGAVVVLSCGNGSIVAALANVGVSVHGVDETAGAIMAGVAEGLDLRVGRLHEYLQLFADESLAAVVLAREVERLRMVDLLPLVDEALRCLAPSGTIVVAVVNPTTRSGAEAELLTGYGLSPQTWAQVLSKRGCVVEVVEVAESRVELLVVASKP